MQQRRTRIVATLGPATDAPGVLEALLDAGIDVARINFAHGTAEEHRARVARLRQAARGRPIAVLADLPGPKLRVLVASALTLTAGQTVTLASAGADIPVTEPELIATVQPNQRILLDDGRLRLRAIRREGDRLIAHVEVGGILLPRKGVNLPDTTFAVPALTAGDREGLAVAALAGADWLALSFVRSAEAAPELRQAAADVGLRVPVLAKIERPEAVRHAQAIVETFDGIMVARGDLGVEMPLEDVPHIQKRLIRLARAAGKPVITATEMLESMRTNSRPTRAEVSDVANAIYDGSDAVMLSGETAVGQHPVEAVSCLDRIAHATESHLTEENLAILQPLDRVEDQFAQGACALAQAVKAKAIIAPTYSGRTSRLVAQRRPNAAIVAPVADEAVRRQLALICGVAAVPLAEELDPGEDRLEAAVRAAYLHQTVRAGDLVVVLAEHPVEAGEKVPTVRVVRVGDKGNSGPP